MPLNEKDPWDVREGKEIGDFTIRTKVSRNQALPDAPYDAPYWVDFECFEVAGLDENSPIYKTQGWTGSMDGFTGELDKAQLFLRGFVKWDGCSEISFLPDNGGQIHFCGRQAVLRLGSLFNQVYDVAKELMGRLDNED